ncbi:MAG: hypothetical protein GXY83_23450 [Rhodopirellula sp.]|nr:hypothetical protein [Rhodopirellula sp.]
MLTELLLDGKRIDTLDLKALLLIQGVHVRAEVYETFGASHRISRDPLQCSALFLPDGTVVHIADIGAAAPFELSLGPRGNPCLLHRGEFVADVSLPSPTAFYRQRTSRGVPFLGMAVLQGQDVLAFPYLWPCELAKAGLACAFCHCGNFTQQQSFSGTPGGFPFTAQDVAEAVHYAVNVEKFASYVQITGGSTLDTNGECDRIVEILRAIDDIAGLDNIQGEIILYTTPPSDLRQLDRLFAAGADRVACDIEIWDKELATQICPGKDRKTGRRRHLDALLHIASTQGPFRACSTFVVGLEPAESFLAGADYLAANGIVPIPSIWMPHGLPAVPSPVVPDLTFFRTVKKGLAEIYDKYQCEPPGRCGYNVCLCRDTWKHRAELVAIA